MICISEWMVRKLEPQLNYSIRTKPISTPLKYVICSFSSQCDRWLLMTLTGDVTNVELLVLCCFHAVSSHLKFRRFNDDTKMVLIARLYLPLSTCNRRSSRWIICFLFATMNHSRWPSAPSLCNKSGFGAYQGLWNDMNCFPGERFCDFETSWAAPKSITFFLIQGTMKEDLWRVLLL